MKHTTYFVFKVFLSVAVLALATLPNASAQPTEKVIHSFNGGSDGTAPEGALIIDSKGNLYGTTSEGGTAGSGTVFELSPGPNGTWTEKVVYAFFRLIERWWASFCGLDF